MLFVWIDWNSDVNSIGHRFWTNNSIINSNMDKPLIWQSDEDLR